MKTTVQPQKQRTEIRQTSLIEAALQLAAQRTPADITTTDLAHTIGITQGAVFRHFANKEAIWLAVLDWVTITLMARLDAAAKDVQTGTTPPAFTALRNVFLAHVNFVIEQPGVPRVIFQELQRHQETALKARVRTLLQRYRELLLNLLQQAHTQKALRPDIDLQAAALLFIGSIQGLVMQALFSGNVSGMAEQAPGVFAIYQRGLQAHTTD